MTTNAPRSTSAPLLTGLYPCDLGIPGGITRGYHHFAVSEHGVCCVYCGKQPASAVLGEDAGGDGR